MARQFPPELLQRLRKYNTPTISNAVEVFNVRPQTTGFMSSAIKCMFPELGPMVGYAFTAKVRASTPAPKESAELRYKGWEALDGLPHPRIAVIQDLDDPPGLGAYWGEVQTNYHRVLGCIGAITNGSVRDLDEVRTMRFHFFAGSVGVSHAYIHLVEFGTPVVIGGLTVNTGDLIHADKHGVLTIPLDVAERIEDGIAEAERIECEQELINYCQSPGATRKGLEALHRRLRGLPL
jgi:4-hydroxy-4-methyl-2-oxoglutarate aldolase